MPTGRRRRVWLRHSWGFILGDLGELFTNQEEIEMYVCAFCGHVEFFVPERS